MVCRPTSREEEEFFNTSNTSVPIESLSSFCDMCGKEFDIFGYGPHQCYTADICDSDGESDKVIFIDITIKTEKENDDRVDESNHVSDIDTEQVDSSIITNKTNLDTTLVLKEVNVDVMSINLTADPCSSLTGNDPSTVSPTLDDQTGLVSSLPDTIATENDTSAVSPTLDGEIGLVYNLSDTVASENDTSSESPTLDGEIDSVSNLSDTVASENDTSSESPTLDGEIDLVSNLSDTVASENDTSSESPTLDGEIGLVSFPSDMLATENDTSTVYPTLDGKICLVSNLSDTVATENYTSTVSPTLDGATGLVSNDSDTVTTEKDTSTVSPTLDGEIGLVSNLSDTVATKNDTSTVSPTLDGEIRLVSSLSDTVATENDTSTVTPTLDGEICLVPNLSDTVATENLISDSNQKLNNKYISVKPLSYLMHHNSDQDLNVTEENSSTAPLVCDRTSKPQEASDNKNQIESKIIDLTHILRNSTQNSVPIQIQKTLETQMVSVDLTEDDESSNTMDDVTEDDVSSNTMDDLTEDDESSNTIDSTKTNTSLVLTETRREKDNIITINSTLKNSHQKSIVETISIDLTDDTEDYSDNAISAYSQLCEAIKNSKHLDSYSKKKVENISSYKQNKLNDMPSTSQQLVTENKRDGRPDSTTNKCGQNSLETTGKSNEPICITEDGISNIKSNTNKRLKRKCPSLPLYCEHCGTPSLDIQDLKKHKCEKREFYCFVCGDIFKLTSELMLHHKTKHYKSAVRQSELNCLNRDKGRKTKFMSKFFFYCNQCGEGFDFIHLLLEHKRQLILTSEHFMEDNMITVFEELTCPKDSDLKVSEASKATMTYSNKDLVGTSQSDFVQSTCTDKNINSVKEICTLPMNEAPNTFDKNICRISGIDSETNINKDCGGTAKVPAKSDAFEQYSSNHEMTMSTLENTIEKRSSDLSVLEDDIPILSPILVERSKENTIQSKKRHKEFFFLPAREHFVCFCCGKNFYHENELRVHFRVRHEGTSISNMELKSCKQQSPRQGKLKLGKPSFRNDFSNADSVTTQKFDVSTQGSASCEQIHETIAVSSVLDKHSQNKSQDVAAPEGSKEDNQAKTNQDKCNVLQGKATTSEVEKRQPDQRNAKINNFNNEGTKSENDNATVEEIKLTTTVLSGSIIVDLGNKVEHCEEIPTTEVVLNETMTKISKAKEKANDALNVKAFEAGMVKCSQVDNQHTKKKVCNITETKLANKSTIIATPMNSEAEKRDPEQRNAKTNNNCNNEGTKSENDNTMGTVEKIKLTTTVLSGSMVDLGNKVQRCNEIPTTEVVLNETMTKISKVTEKANDALNVKAFEAGMVKCSLVEKQHTKKKVRNITEKKLPNKSTIITKGDENELRPLKDTHRKSHKKSLSQKASKYCTPNPYVQTNLSESPENVSENPKIVLKSLYVKLYRINPCHYANTLKHNRRSNKNVRHSKLDRNSSKITKAKEAFSKLKELTSLKKRKKLNISKQFIDPIDKAGESLSVPNKDQAIDNLQKDKTNTKDNIKTVAMKPLQKIQKCDTFNVNEANNIKPTTEALVKGLNKNHDNKLPESHEKAKKSLSLEQYKQQRMARCSTVAFPESYSNLNSSVTKYCNIDTNFSASNIFNRRVSSEAKPSNPTVAFKMPERRWSSVEVGASNGGQKLGTFSHIPVQITTSYSKQEMDIINEVNKQIFRVGIEADLAQFSDEPETESSSSQETLIPLFCEVCGVQTCSSEALNHHMKHTHFGFSFKCFVCDVACKNLDSLINHQTKYTKSVLLPAENQFLRQRKSMPNQAYPYHCNLCGMGFTLIALIALHKKYEHDEKNNSKNNSRAAKDTFKETSKTATAAVDRGDKILDDRNLTGEDTKYISDDELNFSSETIVANRHVVDDEIGGSISVAHESINKSGEKNYVSEDDDQDPRSSGVPVSKFLQFCEICGKKHSSLLDKQTHFHLQKFDCVICRRNFEELDLLATHYDLRHPKHEVINYEKTDISIQKSYKYYCIFCGIGFYFINELLSHKEVDHYELLNEVPTNTNKATPEEYDKDDQGNFDKQGKASTEVVDKQNFYNEESLTKEKEAYHSLIGNNNQEDEGKISPKGNSRLEDIFKRPVAIPGLGDDGATDADVNIQILNDDIHRTPILSATVADNARPDKSEIVDNINQKQHTIDDFIVSDDSDADELLIDLDSVSSKESSQKDFFIDVKEFNKGKTSISQTNTNVTNIDMSLSAPTVDDDTRWDEAVTQVARMLNDESFIEDTGENSVKSVEPSLVTTLLDSKKQNNIFCEACGGPFESREDFTMHYTNNHEENHFSCCLCDLRCKTIALLILHQDQCHPVESLRYVEKYAYTELCSTEFPENFKYYCNLCGQGFNYITEMKLHLNSTCPKKADSMFDEHCCVQENSFNNKMDQAANSSTTLSTEQTNSTSKQNISAASKTTDKASIKASTSKSNPTCTTCKKSYQFWHQVNEHRAKGCLFKKDPKSSSHSQKANIQTGQSSIESTVSIEKDISKINNFKDDLKNLKVSNTQKEHLIMESIVSKEKYKTCDLYNKSNSLLLVKNQNKLTKSGMKEVPKKSHVCSFCGKAFTYNIELTDHRLHKCKQLVPTRKETEKIVNFFCSHCPNRTFGCDNALRQHTQAKHTTVLAVPLESQSSKHGDVVGEPSTASALLLKNEAKKVHSSQSASNKTIKTTLKRKRSQLRRESRERMELSDLRTRSTERHCEEKSQRKPRERKRRKRSNRHSKVHEDHVSRERHEKHGEKRRKVEDSGTDISNKKKDDNSDNLEGIYSFQEAKDLTAMGKNSSGH